MYHCALCSIHACNNGQLEKAPKSCPCLHEKMPVIKELYQEEENYKIAHSSAKIVSQNYGQKTRLEEIMDFAKECGYKNIGLAFCIGLANESRMFNKVLSYNGFSVNSVICKTGNIERECIGLSGSVPMCNPIGQAEFLNEVQTDMNVILGLCIGHDTLFIKYSKAPVTIFSVKDRVLGHNPMAAIYQAEAYYKDKFFPLK
jgi:uncharacterized metal-binding protein